MDMPTSALRPRFTVSQDVVRLSARCPVRFVELPVERQVAPHDHEYYELCFVIAGTGRHRTDEGVTRLSRGDVLVLPVGAVHAFEDTKGLQVINGYYLAEWLLGQAELQGEAASLMDRFVAAHLFRAPTFCRPRTIRLVPAVFERCLIEVEDIVNETSAAEPSRLFLRLTLMKLFMRLQRFWPTDDPAAGLAGLRPEIRAMIDEIEARVLDGERYAAGDVGRNLELSRRHLDRLFKQETGWTPLEYYQRRRIQVACRLLLDAEHAIDDIVHELGFSDGPHFSRVFKAVTGRTPREYRRLYVREPAS